MSVTKIELTDEQREDLSIDFRLSEIEERAREKACEALRSMYGSQIDEDSFESGWGAALKFAASAKQGSVRYVDTAETELTQILPTNDIKEHIDSEHCGCVPGVSDGLLIHNSFDRREAVEDAERKVNELVAAARSAFAELTTQVTFGRMTHSNALPLLEAAIKGCE